MKYTNKEQIAASCGETGTTLVIAGAGTGKTTTMIRKIINCIDNGITTPDRVLIMTFSRKAAGEIRERLENKSDNLKEIGFAGTFHAFSLNILKHYSKEYFLMRESKVFPEIIDDDLKIQIMREIVMKVPSRFCGIPCDAVLSIADNIDRLDSHMIKKLKNSSVYHEIKQVSEDYRNYKKDKNLIDYEDMINEASLLIIKNESVRTDIHSRFNYIFVDEFQDTSENNMKLLEQLLPHNNRNLFMVGDDYQSIYKFRRARVEYIINIQKYFPETEIHKLTTNYRSRKEIVDISNRFISLNRFRTEKKIKSSAGKGGKVRFHSAQNATNESSIISNIIRSAGNFCNIGILYRNNYQGDVIQKHCADLLSADVYLMTMHGSKGLEFDIVIIAGVSDRIIPDRTSDIEEERRLFYVAMTRGKHEIHFIYHKNSNGRLPRFIWELGFREY